MSKAKLMLDVVNDMRSLAGSLQAIANEIAQNERDKTEESVPVKQPKKSIVAKKKEVKLEDVRAVLAQKSQAGMTVEVRDIIKKYGGTKLSDVDPVHYVNILKDAEGLSNE